MRLSLNIIKYLCCFVILIFVAVVFAKQLVYFTIKNVVVNDQNLDYVDNKTLRGFFYDSIGSTPIATNAYAKLPSLSTLSWILSSSNDLYLNQPSLDDVTSSNKKRYTLSVGYLRNLGNVSKIIDELNSKGLPAASTVINNYHNDKIFRIDVGLYLSKSEAKEALEILSKRTNYKGMIVPLN